MIILQSNLSLMPQNYTRLHENGFEITKLVKKELVISFCTFYLTSPQGPDRNTTTSVSELLVK